MNIRFTVGWDVTLCCLVDRYQRSVRCCCLFNRVRGDCEDDGSRFFRNTGTCIPNDSRIPLIWTHRTR